MEGGSCNDYDYVCGDPVNGLDLTGRELSIGGEYIGQFLTGEFNTFQGEVILHAGFRLDNPGYRLEYIRVRIQRQTGSGIFKRFETIGDTGTQAPEGFEFADDSLFGATYPVSGQLKEGRHHYRYLITVKVCERFTGRCGTETYTSDRTELFR